MHKIYKSNTFNYRLVLRRLGLVKQGLVQNKKFITSMTGENFIWVKNLNAIKYNTRNRTNIRAFSFTQLQPLCGTF